MEVLRVRPVLLRTSEECRSLKAETRGDGGRKLDPMRIFVSLILAMALWTRVEADARAPLFASAGHTFPGAADKPQIAARPGDSYRLVFKDVYACVGKDRTDAQAIPPAVVIAHNGMNAQRGLKTAQSLQTAFYLRILLRRTVRTFIRLGSKT